MTSQIPTHSGSRWEPLPQFTPAATDDVLVPLVAPSSAGRTSRTPRVLVAAVVSALALGGAGTTIAVARSTEPTSPVSGPAAPAHGADRHDRHRS